MYGIMQNIKAPNIISSEATVTVNVSTPNDMIASRPVPVPNNTSTLEPPSSGPKTEGFTSGCYRSTPGRFTSGPAYMQEPVNVTSVRGGNTPGPHILINYVLGGPPQGPGVGPQIRNYVLGGQALQDPRPEQPVPQDTSNQREPAHDSRQHVIGQTTDQDLDLSKTAPENNPRFRPSTPTDPVEPELEKIWDLKGSTLETTPSCGSTIAATVSELVHTSNATLASRDLSKGLVNGDASHHSSFEHCELKNFTNNTGNCVLYDNERLSDACATSPFTQSTPVSYCDSAISGPLSGSNLHIHTLQPLRNVQVAASKCSLKYIMKEYKYVSEDDYFDGDDSDRDPDFVPENTSTCDVELIDGSKSRNKTLEYSFEIHSKSVTVCKKFFLATLKISDTAVTTALKKKGAAIVRNGMIDHTAKFPTYFSRYTRERSQCKYLRSHLSIERMHRLYVQEWKDENIPVNDIGKSWLYRDIFNTEFNLAFYQPDVDTCNYCDRYHILIKEATSEEDIAKKLEEITVWSDNCTEQNINVMMIACYLLLLHTFKSLKVIDHKYISKCHAHLEFDTIHAVIDQAKKKQPHMSIVTPWDWQQMMRNCEVKANVEVLSMEVHDILYFHSLFVGPSAPFISRSKGTDGQQPRRSLEMSYIGLPVRDSLKEKSCLKYKDLMKLLQWIPQQFHDYYINLPQPSSVGDFPDITIPTLDDRLGGEQASAPTMPWKGTSGWIGPGETSRLVSEGKVLRTWRKETSGVTVHQCLGYGRWIQFDLGSNVKVLHERNFMIMDLRFVNLGFKVSNSKIRWFEMNLISISSPALNSNGATVFSVDLRSDLRSSFEPRWCNRALVLGGARCQDTRTNTSKNQNPSKEHEWRVFAGRQVCRSVLLQAGLRHFRGNVWPNHSFSNPFRTALVF
ncbi:hypothetical protein PR048_001733 [Dryococelus australis]|uniref:Uncharacterized protein n=1 Tax=Dryococelus australis TaxID=614101 RepID=A0ABQ9II48_9NEOP|nr:hypothetical protein PR048_001733 [Dryococelus australis]